MNVNVYINNYGIIKGSNIDVNININKEEKQVPEDVLMNFKPYRHNIVDNTTVDKKLQNIINGKL